jgi:hypothetical protein
MSARRLPARKIIAIRIVVIMPDMITDAIS